VSIILFLIILLVLILVHEFGHFIVAKKSGIRIDEFGIGFPPRALRLAKRGDTEYTLNWLPLGGFVKIFGENPDEESIHGPDKNRSFVNKPKIIQAAVLAAGVVFNIVFAWFIFSIVFMIGMPSAILEDELDRAYNVRLVVAEVLPDTPAEQIGLLAGDELISLSDGTSEITDLVPSSVSAFIAAREEVEIVVSLKRDDEEKNFKVIPKSGIISDQPDRAALGFSMGLVGNLKFSPLEAFWEGLTFTIEITKLIAIALSAFLIDAALLNANLSEIAGPVGIVSLVGEASSLGLVFLLNFTAFISINLALINLLPFPALDGGRLLFLFIEIIKGSPIQPSIANAMNTVGFVLLILLMLVVTYNDILRIISQ